MSVLNINRGNAPTNPVYMQLSAGVIQPARTVTAATDTATIDDYLILDNAASNAITQKLPAGLSSVQTAVLVIKKTDSTANTVTIDGNGATIDGASTLVLYTQNSAVTLQWNGATWSVESFNSGNWATYTPVVTASGSMTVSGLTINQAQFLRVGNDMRLSIVVSFTLGGTASTTILITTPLNAVGASAQYFVTSINDSAGSNVPGTTFLQPATNGLNVNLSNNAIFPLGAALVGISGAFRIA